ncbi:MAG TPA: hypothetical protein VGM82_23280 [Gemmatimonadaceae bacterium]
MVRSKEIDDNIRGAGLAAAAGMASAPAIRRATRVSLVAALGDE